ncbi:MAG: M15 family metallopeptidase [Sphingomonas sp.]
MVLPTVAMALTPVALCPGQDIEPMADGRMLGHLPYAEANPIDLVTIPGDFGAGRPCVMHRDAAAAVVQLLAAADLVPTVKGKLRGLSCFRTVERQRQIFCSQIGPKKRCANAAERAKSSGPPGYSEHATGYTLDFAIRPLTRACGDVSDCIARTAPGKWLLQHAAEFGFELSFPAGNAQGVTWEPWHWRWVGASASSPSAAAARALFATARSRFPAQPGIPEIVLPPEWQRAIAPTPSPAPTWPK